MDFLFDQDHQEWVTLTQISPARRRRRSSSLVIAAGLHVTVLAILCWPAAPLFVRPNLIAHGQGGKATPESVILYLPDHIQIATQRKPALLSLPTPSHQKPQTRVKKRTNALEAEKPSNSLEAGSEVGSGYDGSTD